LRRETAQDHPVGETQCAPLPATRALSDRTARQVFFGHPCFGVVIEPTHKSNLRVDLCDRTMPLTMARRSRSHLIEPIQVSFGMTGKTNTSRCPRFVSFYDGGLDCVTAERRWAAPQHG
jgi:hypothetical protein